MNYDSKTINKQKLYIYIWHAIRDIFLTNKERQDIEG